MNNLLSNPALVNIMPTTVKKLNFTLKNTISAKKPTTIARYPRGMVYEGYFREVAAKIVYWASRAKTTTRTKAKRSERVRSEKRMEGGCRLDKIPVINMWPI